MKKLILIFLAGAIFASCNNAGKPATDSSKDSLASAAPAQVMNYPYTIEHPDNWDMGNKQNTMTMLTGLKAFENGNIAECMKSFGDSIHMRFEGLDKTVSNDSLMAMFTRNRAGIKSMSIKMEDWESVISKDKKTEYVTLWYTESVEDMSGKKDSMDVVNDAKMKDGKCIELSQYTRKIN
ncbi:MAG: hypothetical protein ABIP35_15120 [Ginsengibacter sp.]